MATTTETDSEIQPSVIPGAPPRPARTPMRFDPSTVQRLHRALLARGEKLATLLSEVLAGKNAVPALTSAGIDLRPGIRPEEALRKALDQVERRRVLLHTGDDRYGRCDECGVDLGEVALVELPWADRCAAHAAT